MYNNKLLKYDRFITERTILLNKKYYWTNEFTEQMILLNIVHWENERNIWKINDIFDYEQNKFFKQIKNERNGSITNDEQTKFKKEECAHLFVHAPISMYMCPSLCTCTHLYVHGPISMYMRPSLCTCAHLYLHAPISMYMRPSLCTCAHLYVHGPISMYMRPSLCTCAHLYVQRINSLQFIERNCLCKINET